MALSEEEKNIIKNRYRFQGYQLPKIQLDETGPSYYDVSPHPYFYNQPRFWEQAVFGGSPYVDFYTGNEPVITATDNPPVIDTSERGLSEEQPRSVTPELEPEPPLQKNKSSSLYNFLPPN